MNDFHKFRAKMQMLGIMREAKNMIFHPQYAQCFTATNYLPETYEYNFQSQNISAVSNIPNNITVNSPNVSDELSYHSSEFWNL